MNGSYFVHHKSAEALKSELDLFSVPYTQTSILSSVFTEYRPINSIEDQKTIEFNIPGNGEEYTDPSDIHLNVKARILKSDGTVCKIDEKVTPVNGFLHSLFSEVSINLGNKLITSTDQEYPYKAYLGIMLSNNDIKKTKYLPLEMFYKDSNTTELNPTNLTKGEGLYQRHERSKGSKTMDMIGRLQSDVFNQNKFLPPTINLTIKLVRKSDKFSLLQPETNKNEYKIELKSAILYVRKLRINPSVSAAHQKMWLTTPMKLPLRRIDCRSFNIARDSRDVYLNNVYDGQMPCFVVIALVNSDARAGNVHKNPFNFVHKGLSFLDLQVDSTSFPGVPFQPNFAAGEYSRLHQQLFLSSGKYYGTEGIDISYEEFANGYSLFAYDLTSDESGSSGSHFNLGKNGTMRICMKFQQALEETINVIVYGAFQTVAEIDYQGNVVWDF